MDRFPNRLTCLCLILLAGVTSALTSGALETSPAPAGTSANLSPWTRDDAAHLLRRAAFGGTPEQVDRLFALGRDAAVNYLIDGTLPKGAAPVFAPAKLDDFEEPAPEKLSKKEEKTLAQAQAIKQSTKDPSGAAKPIADSPDNQAAIAAAKALKGKAKQERQRDIQDLRTWWIDRMVRTDRPLAEKMTLFWHGLFTSGIKEVKNPEFLSDQDALFHREALGNYKRLTNDAIHGAAILKYLNNDQNVKGKPNENLARELMELFTMGEGQGYNETDIKQVALALTGLSPEGGKKSGEAKVEFRLRDHDTSMKTIFGKTGNFGPDDVVNLIFAQPQPAHHLAQKLWEFYASPDPTDADLAPVIAALNQSGFELKPALRALFTSPAFYSDKAKFELIKSPIELAVEQFRTLGQVPAHAEEFALANRLKEMNQELFQPPNVRGWVGGDNWITAATLYTRYNTSSADVNGTLQKAGMGGGMGGGANKGGGGKGNGNRNKNKQQNNAHLPKASPDAIQPATLFASLGTAPTPQKVVDAAIARFIQRPLDQDKRAALLDFIGSEPLKLGDAASDARIRQMICLLLSTPEYQLH